jgi:hypothetical protein
MKEFNLNSTIYVRLHEKGFQRLADAHNEFCSRIPNWEKRTPEHYQKMVNDDGYYSFQAWDFIQTFGPVTSLGMHNIYDINILIEDSDLKDANQMKKWYTGT